VTITYETKLKMKKIISKDEKLVSIVNRSIKNTDLMKYVTNMHLRQDEKDKDVYYVIIEVRYTNEKNTKTSA
jgi:ribosome-binding factor A